MLNIILAVLVIYMLYLTGGCALQRRIVFPRHFTRHDPDAAGQHPEAEIWEIATGAGKTVAWFFQAAGPDSPDHPAGPAVVFAYGNSELMEDWAPLLKPYLRAGVSVLLPEYRGYGFSDGTPSQDAIVEDFTRFFDRLAERDSVDDDRIFFHGRSLGGGVVCALSRQRRPAALVLSSTFTSVADMARRFLFPPVLIKDPFDNLSAVRRYDGPVLLLHGREDGVTPFRHAEKLKGEADDAELAPLPGDHNNMDPYIAGGEAWEHIFDFLKRRGVLGE